MSASREKKKRQELGQTGPSEKQLQAAEEKKKLRKFNVIALSVTILVLAVAVYGVVSLVVMPKLAPKKTALTIGDRDISAAEMNFVYLDTVYNFYNTYGSYLDAMLDPAVPLDEQIYDEETQQTWAGYFMEGAVTSARAIYSVSSEAIANGYTLSEEDEASLQASLDDLENLATTYGYSSVDHYLGTVYGLGCTADLYMDYQRAQMIASQYSEAYRAELSYSDEVLQAKYDEDPNVYTNATYRYFYLPVSNYEPEAAEGETAEDPTEEEQAEYMALAEADAREMAEAAEGDEQIFADYAHELAAEASKESYEDPDFTLKTNTSYEGVPEYFRDWLYDEAREDGDTTYIEADDMGYYVLYFIETLDNNYNTVNVRHILSSPVNDEDLDGDGTADAASADALSIAKASIEDILNEWLAGDATEESFAELATTYSSDSAEGGLYENIYQGQMVTEFNDWCFDESRQPGDYEIVATDYGYHLIYFVSFGDIYRDILIDEDLRTADYNEWYNGVIDGAEVVKHENGMAEVNVNVTLS